MPGRSLVIGASGQLGRQLVRLLRAAGEEVLESACHHRAPGQHPIDLRDPEGAVRAVKMLRPDQILIAGAYCNVDGAESEPTVCHQINAGTPRRIAEAGRDRLKRLVYFSTDYLFNGRKGEPYRETDPIIPLNQYARSKADGEAAIRTLLPDRHLILRTAWLFGPDPVRKNFILRLVDRLRAGEPASIPIDQWGTPTYTEDVAKATQFLLQQGDTGIFHAAGPDFVDRRTLSEQVCRRFNLDLNLLKPLKTVELKQRAARPLQVRMDCRKLRQASVPPFRNLEAGLTALFEWEQGRDAA
ncbi:MAG: hypothetical protein COV76_01655 [Candidatus Omnitrophica bacterium CG11_big_fil_rev_8_21_14_0_20_64_10]|nr:MAG: hypothetical protein COV76_01655 [Candidatus Omnitrophica bacterium CG11_big_fil_rev_8_21_14_0_20_64_10]